jgi:1-aminocyclopropane-1-carboxylate deaminase/D-cysteine desulfhydrase-like pyridoxal-dependent ACC family enzyme
LNQPSLTEPPIQRLHLPALSEQKLIADVLRLDLLHPVVSGNKWFKLHKHLELAPPHAPLLTFGGAWSNHLVATAFAARETDRGSIGIIRGERPGSLSDTLQEAQSYGMTLDFVSRQVYSAKAQPNFLRELLHRYPGAYIIPEGGGGMPGILGSEAILHRTDLPDYTHILCAIGTGTTWIGLVRAARPHTTVVGIPVLKGIASIADIDREGLLTPEQLERARILPGYHFGGYARHPQPPLDFMNNLYSRTGIQTDIVYTGKLFYALWNIVDSHFFPAHSRLLIIHSGGLQGNRSLAPGRLIF